MVRREDASGRVDPKTIGTDKFRPRTLANTLDIETLLPFFLVFNGDTIIHTYTLVIRTTGGAQLTTSFQVAAGSCAALPTLMFAAISSDSAGTPSSSLVIYTDVAPTGFKAAGGTGLSGNSKTDGPRTNAATVNAGKTAEGYGANWTFTPKQTGTVIVTMSCTFIMIASGAVNTVAQGTIFGQFGTGAAPANGAQAGLGTQIQSGMNFFSQSQGVGSSLEVPFCLTALLTGLVVGTTYWFDLAFGIVGGLTSTQAATAWWQVSEYPT